MKRTSTKRTSIKGTSTKRASINGTSTQRSTIKTAERSVSLSPKWRQITISAVSGLGVGFAITFLSSSIPIASAFALMGSAITFIFLASKAKRDETKFELLWPDVVDHLITGIQSGMSLVESLSQLAERGPRELTPYFAEFNRQIRKDGDFNSAVNWLQNQFSHYASDQIFEALILSRSLGGTHLLQILRMVGDFIRQDLALRKEIEVKHGWIKNSAHLSAAAPWLLLLLLSTQPATVTAYSTATGAVILISGIFMTAVAYFWMNKLGALPKPPRVFGSDNQKSPRLFGADNQRSPRLFGSKSQNIIASRQVSTR
jgi:tight adherence protein B